MASLEGQTLGKYRVLEPLGRGGMARVYRAYHPKLDRYVAIKVMRSDLVDDEEFLGRFGREARTIANLRHTNIVQVFDFDSQDDTYYMVMELLEGDTLKTRLNDYRIRNEKMPYGEVVRVLLDVLSGLEYAHSEGMVHRDIKPANILLTKKGQAVVADFGIAQIVGGTRHTMSGALMGTLNYMAPEGVQGQYDHRGDLYALGIVFFEMLTQTTPFEGDTPLAVLMKHVNDPLPLPKEFDPDIPDAFERILLKVLSKDVEDRYQSAAEMIEALHVAVKTLDLDLPGTISLPLSFTTDEAPSESVAVFSGTVRDQLLEDHFSADDTAGVTHIEQLKAQEKLEQAAVNSTSGQKEPDRNKNKSDEARLLLDKLPSNMQVLLGVGVLVGANLVAILLGGFMSSNAFARGWPFEIFAVATFLCLIAYAEKNGWIFIPIGILVGNAVLFGYSSLFSAWDQWSFLWTLEPLIVLGSVFGVIYFDQTDRMSPELVQNYAFEVGRFSLAGTIFMILAGVLGFSF